MNGKIAAYVSSFKIASLDSHEKNAVAQLLPVQHQNYCLIRRRSDFHSIYCRTVQ